MTMRTYFFHVILKVQFEGRPMEALLYKAIHAESEHLARRLLLNRYINDGFQVLRLDRVEERKGEVAEGWLDL